ncbi:nitrous oxide reductase accessory protein NosL [Rudanella lutea]|uniref:nitrous oxide reductase accessory protein NosL n=1 Tax=Rudanella lutea TaxID=451374 RepID=UPI000379030B|nr:nitrous oxide reductase accessory protein NosL [Rudanella lutea]
MKTTSRFAVLLAALSLIGTYFLPLWRIDLWAPQYPEGLVMKIWLNKLSGDVEVINGLNHYIGMAHIKEEMFPEFTYMPWLVGGFILFGLLTAALRNRVLLLTNLVLFVGAGVLALYDFWKWGYEYGHNLDPKAPIQVPGMAYQPPVIGYKALLNFGAYSVPDVGGWIFIVAGLLVAGATACEWYFCKKSPSVGLPGGLRRGAVATGVLLAGLISQGCEVKPEPIRYGHDACAHCKMTIVDQKFAAQFVTKKGRSFTFDDVACMAHYLSENDVAEADVAFVQVDNYNKPGTPIDANEATFVQGEQYRSPMAGNLAAFPKAEGKSGRSWGEVKAMFGKQ